MYMSDDEEEFQDMEGIDLDVSVDRVLKDNDEAKDERLTRFGGRALSFGLAIVALIAAAVGIAVWLRQENKQTIPSGINSPDSNVPISTLSQRNRVDDCWVALYGNVYNMTNYNHPGPQAWITGNCGSDATAEYSAAHPEVYMRTIEHLHVGTYEAGSESPVDLSGNTSVASDDENDIASNNSTTETTTDNTENDIPANNSSNSSSVTDGVSDQDENLPTNSSIFPDEDLDDFEIIDGPFYNKSGSDAGEDPNDELDDTNARDDDKEDADATDLEDDQGDERENDDKKDKEVKDDKKNKDDEDNERTVNFQGEDSDKKKDKDKKEKDKKKGKNKKNKDK